MPTEIIAIAIGIIITWLIFTWLVKVLKASISTIVTIAILLLLAQIFLGIHYEQIWQEFSQFIEQLI